MKTNQSRFVALFRAFFEVARPVSMPRTETPHERARRLQAEHAARIDVRRIPTRFNKSTSTKL